MNSKACTGFTLIEIIVVLLVIGIASGMVMISGGAGNNSAAADAAEGLYKTLKSLSPEAVLAKEEIGVAFDNNRLYFLVYDEDKGAWRNETHLTSGSYGVDNGIQLSMQVEGREVSLNSRIKPAIIFYSSGDITPFILRLASGRDAPPSFIIRTDTPNDITLEKP